MNSSGKLHCKENLHFWYKESFKSCCSAKHRIFLMTGYEILLQDNVTKHYGRTLCGKRVKTNQNIVFILFNDSSHTSARYLAGKLNAHVDQP